MNFYILLLNFDEDFCAFTEHIVNHLLQSGLMLDEHECQILTHFKLNPQGTCKRTNFKFFKCIHYLLSILSRSISRYFVNYYKSSFDELILNCRKQVLLNVCVKRHFERRLSYMKVLGIANTLKQSSLIQQEINFLNDFSLLLTQTNKSMIETKESIINDNMNTLDFQLFETIYAKGSDLEECVNTFKVTADMFIYNTSEFLTALVLSFLHPFKLNDSIIFHNLNKVLPTFLRSFKMSLEERERMFEKTKYLITLTEQSHSTDITKDKKLLSEDFVNHQLNETLRTLQVTFEIVTKIQKDYNTRSCTCDKDFDHAKVCLTKSLENISYLDKLIHTKATKRDDDAKLPSVILAKEDIRKIISIDSLEDKPIDEVFSCYVSDNREVSLNQDYDDLFQNYSSQKMLITELQEKLHLLTNLEGRKIAPGPGDQLLPKKAQASSILDSSLDINVSGSHEKDIAISLPPPCPPKMPVFDLFTENTTNFSTAKSLANQVKEIANKDKREEEVFGSDNSLSESEDEL